MAYRGAESPMDFQYEKPRPVDPSSPFVRNTMTNDKKRSHATINSPGKNNFPSFREPNGKPFFFSNPPKDAPTSPWRAPSFTTPRKNYDYDFSSGPESSPVAPTEDDDTPNGKPLPATPAELRKKKRESTFSKMFGTWAGKSGKGEIQKPFSDGVVKRVHKRRRQAQSFEKQIARARKESEESSEDELPAIKNKKQKQTQPPIQEVGWMTGLFTFIHTYPDAPSIIAKYLQVFFNAAILFGCLYMFYSFYATIRFDIDQAAAGAANEILAEMTLCKQNWMVNRCEGANRLPALQEQCEEWGLCMSKDESAVKRAKLSAHAFAEIFNSFVEPISLKTMVFTTLIVGLALLINNATFTIYRRSQEHQHDVYRHSSGQYSMPPGPYPGQMGHFGMTPGLPYQTPQQYGWAPGQGQLDYNQSPSKDRGGSRSPAKKRLALTDE